MDCELANNPVIKQPSNKYTGGHMSGEILLEVNKAIIMIKIIYNIIAPKKSHFSLDNPLRIILDDLQTIRSLSK